MPRNITQDRNAQVNEAAAALGASIAGSYEQNEWNVIVAGKHVGTIRFSPRARVWLAKTGNASTVGELLGCLKFLISRN